MFPNLQCQYCNRRFGNHRDLQQHLYHEHPECFSFEHNQEGGGRVQNIEMVFDVEALEIVQRYHAHMATFECNSNTSETDSFRAVKASFLQVMRDHMTMW
jgi:hypothetical protein